MKQQEQQDKTSVDDYISSFSGETKSRLLIMQELITSTVPEAVESISYGLVGYKYKNKPLVYFGGFDNHTGFYATPNSHEAFKKDFAPYKQGKGSVQFPHSVPLPTDLIKKVTKFRLSSLQHEGDGDE